nr:CD3072 family TudS-related putative desulfidase [Sedimentibacter sp.]
MALKRNKKIVLVAHCILNINAKVYGIATEPAGCRQIVSALLDNGYGIIQLPCVEQSCFGIKRWGQVKDQMNFPGFRSKCYDLLKPIIEQILDFYYNGYEISAVIGLDGSPACGVNYTCTGNWGGEIGEGYDLQSKICTLNKLTEYGVMMEVLAEMLDKSGIDTKFLSVDESNPEASSQDLIAELVE